MTTRAACIYPSVAHDTVSHRILIHKLYNTSTLCRFFQYMLFNQRLQVELNNEQSRWRNQKCPLLLSLFKQNRRRQTTTTTMPPLKSKPHTTTHLSMEWWGRQQTRRMSRLLVNIYKDHLCVTFQNKPVDGCARTLLQNKQSSSES